jgi:anti-sigma B factor antagonist
MNEELPIRTTSRNGAAVVSPVGEVDMSTSPELRVALLQALKTEPTALVVNLAEVPSLDSSGVATLIEALRETQGRKIPLVLCSLAPRVLAVLEIARLDRVFTIASDVDEALEVRSR